MTDFEMIAFICMPLMIGGCAAMWAIALVVGLRPTN